MLSVVPCVTTLLLPNGRPAEGTLTFLLSEAMEDTSTGHIVAPVLMVATFDATGSIEQQLVANDDSTTITASGAPAYYTVTAEITGQGTQPSYQVKVPSANAGKLTELSSIRIAP